MRNKFTMTLMSFIMLLTGTSCEEIIPTLELDIPISEITFSPLAEDRENVKVEVNTNQSNWTVYGEHTWCNVTKGEDYFIISAEKYKTSMGSPRRTHVVVSVDDLEPIRIPILQNPISLDVEQPLEYNLPEEGGTIEIRFSCNYEWTISSNQEWAKVDITNGKKNGNIKVKVLPSEKDIVTEAKITIASGNYYMSVLITRDYKHPIYKIGDLYPNEENPIGIVFNTYNNGKNGLATTLKNKRSRYSDIDVYTGATSYSDGAFNTTAVLECGYSIYAFPAFDYCTRYGKGWYFPSFAEAMSIILNREEINDKIESAGGDAVGTSLGTSTEYHSGKCVLAILRSENTVEREYIPKGTEVNVRAVISF